MSNTLASILIGKIFEKTVDTLLKPHSPLVPPAKSEQAVEIAHQVQSAVKPIVENAVNAEPWYKSRIYIGLIVAGVGIVGSKFGINIPGSEVDTIVTIVLQAMEVFGLVFAAYGRVVGASKPPLGG